MFKVIWIWSTPVKKSKRKEKPKYLPQNTIKYYFYRNLSWYDDGDKLKVGISTTIHNSINKNI